MVVHLFVLCVTDCETDRNALAHEPASIISVEYGKSSDTSMIVH
jgi:hypothetical protein